MPTPALAPETLTLAQQAQAFITNEACLIGPDTSSRTKPFLFYVRHNGCLVHKRFYMTFKWDGDTDFCYVITPDSSLEEGVRQIVKLSPHWTYQHTPHQHTPKQGKQYCCYQPIRNGTQCGCLHMNPTSNCNCFVAPPMPIDYVINYKTCTYDHRHDSTRSSKQRPPPTPLRPLGGGDIIQHAMLAILFSFCNYFLEDAEGYPSVVLSTKLIISIDNFIDKELFHIEEGGPTVARSQNLSLCIICVS
jgi:hypothetical protein